MGKSYSFMELFGMIGKVYGELKVIRVSNKPHSLDCLCSCGTNYTVRAMFLARGCNISCGCLLRSKDKESMKKAVKSISKDRQYGGLYNSWSGMKKRCNTKTSYCYPRYGGRGITYADRWEDFDAFKEDMEELWFQDAHIDRIDNDESYSKSNCQWLTPSEHAIKTQRERN